MPAWRVLVVTGPARHPRRGVSAVEALVAVSIIASLAVLGASAFSEVLRSMYEVDCRQQLALIGDALERYRDEHRDQDPQRLDQLVPDYLPESALVCPFVRARVPQVVARLQDAAQGIAKPESGLGGGQEVI